MRRTKVLLLCLGILSISCNESTFVRTIYGVKGPKIETSESIATWLLRNGFTNVQVYSLAPNSFYDAFILGYTNSFRIFGRDGQFLSIGYSDSYFCPRDFADYLRTLKPYNQLIPKPASFLVLPPFTAQSPSKNTISTQSDTLRPTLNELNSLIRDLNGDKVTLSTDVFVEYTLIIPFAVGKGNRIQVKEIKKYYAAAQKNEQVRFRVVFLNTDKQAWWGDEWNEKIKISY